ncbi:MAG TPA: RsmE family RNA methyltransferase [Acidimicrobiales bacterium]|nr:RsmE family RNA methyltransferase [Acidimicrobiales bacterium]
MPSSRAERDLRASAAHVFVADVAAPELRDDDRHHLQRVLRLRAGETVTVSDGLGSWRSCAFRGGAGLEPAGEVSTEARPEPVITVGFAPVKGDRPEWAVQKLVEVGADVIVPFTSARSVVRWDGDKAARNRDRLERVAVEAAMQSRRVWLPEVREIGALDAAMARVRSGCPAGGPAGSPAGGRLALAEPGGEPLSLAFPTVFIGPEGGWSPEELALDVGHVCVSSTILRAETATMAAAVLLCALRGKIVQSHDE